MDVVGVTIPAFLRSSQASLGIDLPRGSEIGEGEGVAAATSPGNVGSVVFDQECQTLRELVATVGAFPTVGFLGPKERRLRQH